ncbi:LOW QUALITY PROTEIN: uncharacterized protein LOC135938363 [Cloeon dipterum]|uniref:LOW QUALITY PROTEIN: uncharacterized protein LOC135938363 n=1 Tax=Cloeon dipterum TaxID=197152 RepID=UPI00321FFCEF
MPLVLYCYDGSPSNRAVYMCLKALGLEVIKKPVDLFKGEQLKPEFLKMNPQHTLPTLVDGDLIIWDSHVICSYLVGKYTKDDSLYPKDLQKRALVDQRLHFDSGVLFPRFMSITFPLLVLKCKEIPEKKKASVKEAFAFMEKFLEGGEYLAGASYTIADICCISTVSTIVGGLGISADEYPNVKAWMKRCRENLPGYEELNQPGVDGYKRIVARELACDNMPLVLHCFDGSPPNRAVYLCLKALGLEVTKKTVNLFNGEHLDPDFVKLNPQHTIPTLEDDDFVIWDSHVICSYLVDKYAEDDSLYPKDPQKRAIVDQRLHFDTGVLFPRFMNISYPLLFLKCKEIPEEKQKAVTDAFAIMENFLEGNDYLAGDSYTIADICCIATVSTLVEGLRISVEDFPNIKDWMERCRENLPGYAEVNQPGVDAYKGAADRELD